MLVGIAANASMAGGRLVDIDELFPLSRVDARPTPEPAAHP